MNRRPIGYYIHHHGAGHRARAATIAAASEWPVTLMGTGIGAAGVDLPDDRLEIEFDGADGTDCRPLAFHYAPIGHSGVRERTARIAGWIAEMRPALMVVDVSVEVALLARLASVPTVYVRLNGDRTDPAHLEAFRSASALLAPYHAQLELPSTPEWVRRKTRYLPGITAPARSRTSARRRVLVVFGRGGSPGAGDVLARAAAACPDWEWRAIGPVTAPSLPISNLTLSGWTDRPECEIAEASIVVGAAGDGLVSAVLAADKPFICIPQERPFGEQVATARGLAAAGAARVLSLWPEAARWPGLLAEALTLKAGARRALHVENGPLIAASWLAELAAAFRAQRECTA